MPRGRYPRLAALFVTLAVTLAAAPLAAQMTVGVRAGVGAAGLSGGESRPRGVSAFDELRWGIVTGVDAGIPLSGPLSVRLGLGLAGKGGGAEVPLSIATGRAFSESVAEYDYLQFSALLRATTQARQGELTFSLLAGPYVALNHSCNVAVTAHEPPIDPPPPVPPGEPNIVPTGRMGAAADTRVPCGEDGTSAVESSDFGLAFGGGFEVRLTDSLRLAFELMYARGLSEIDDEGQNNQHVYLQTGLVFPIG